MRQGGRVFEGGSVRDGWRVREGGIERVCVCAKERAMRIVTYRITIPYIIIDYSLANNNLMDYNHMYNIRGLLSFPPY